MSYLFDPPPFYVLPIAKRGGLSATFLNNPSGDGTTFVAYAGGDTVTLYIETDPVIEVDATVSGYSATVTIESTDDIPDDTKYQVVLDTSAAPPLVLAYGKVKRFD